MWDQGGISLPFTYSLLQSLYALGPGARFIWSSVGFSEGDQGVFVSLAGLKNLTQKKNKKIEGNMEHGLPFVYFSAFGRSKTAKPSRMSSMQIRC